MHDALTYDRLQEQRGIVVYCVVWYLVYRNKFAVTTKHRPCRGRQTGSTGMPARVRLGLASEPREDSVDCRFHPAVALPAIAPTLPSPHPSLKPRCEASIMNASGRGGTSLHLSSRMHAVSTKVHSPLRYIYHQQSSLTYRMSRCLSLNCKAASLHEWNIPSKSCTQTCETRHRSRHYPEMTLSRLDYTPSTMSRAVDLKYRKLLPIR